MRSKNARVAGTSRGGTHVLVAATVAFMAAAAPAAAGEATVGGEGGQLHEHTGARILLREGAGPDSGDEGSAAAARAADTWSDTGLEARPGVTEAGGTMVPLRGRFRSSVVLRRDAGGTPSADCDANLPARARAD